MTTFSLSKIQAMELFIKENLVFHHAARIKAQVLYAEYEQVLKELNLETYKVEKHNFWALLTLLVPPATALTKSSSRDLYYIGLDLKKNALPPEKVGGGSPPSITSSGP